MQTEVLIVGGGLSGLALARHLHTAGRDFQLIEARDRLGGRIKTQRVAGAGFDLGPAWFWPGQHRIKALTQAFGLADFSQYATGSLSFEDHEGQVMRNQGYASMQGSYRLAGGFGRLIAAIADSLPSDRLHTRHRLQAVFRSDERLKSRLVTPQTEIQIISDQMVLAVPPRVAARRISFEPALPEKAMASMLSIPTWMAGHAKIVAVYNTAFWREQGLSGDAMSRRGPLVEIHDASPAQGGPYALFGFLGVPAPHRRGRADNLRQAALDQFVRLFGEAANSPIEVHYQDWAFDEYTAIDRDQAPLHHHPAYGLPYALADLWDGKLLLGSSEVAPTFGGYLEGALEAAEAAAERLG